MDAVDEMRMERKSSKVHEVIMLYPNGNDTVADRQSSYGLKIMSQENEGELVIQPTSLSHSFCFFCQTELNSDMPSVINSSIIYQS